MQFIVSEPPVYELMVYGLLYLEPHVYRQMIYCI